MGGGGGELRARGMGAPLGRRSILGGRLLLPCCFGGRSPRSPREGTEGTSLRQQHPWCRPRSCCRRRVRFPKFRRRLSPVPSPLNGISMETRSPAPAALQSEGTLLGILFLLMTNDGGSALTEERPRPASLCPPEQPPFLFRSRGLWHVPCADPAPAVALPGADAGQADTGGESSLLRLGLRGS